MKRPFLPFLILTSILIFMFGLVSPALASDGDDLEVINEKYGLPIVVYQDSGRKSLFQEMQKWGVVQPCWLSLPVHG